MQLQVLHLEDNGGDGELIRSTLECDGLACAIHRVTTKLEFETALDSKPYDAILSDFSMPGFDGMSALRIVRDKHPETPFIFVSGTIGEERAIHSLKNGATDYVCKDRLHFLPSALRRARQEVVERLEKERIQKELRENNAFFREITEHVDDLIVILELDGRVKYLSPSCRKLNATISEGQSDFFSFVHPSDRGAVQGALARASTASEPISIKYRFVTNEGTFRHFESHVCRVCEEGGNARDIVVISRDATEHIASVRLLKEQAELLNRTHDAIFILNLEQRITFWNAGSERLYGWTSDEVLGKSAPDFLHWFDTKTVDDVGALDAGDWTGDLPQTTKDGRKIWVASHRTLLKDAAGEPTSLLIINFDVTERKTLETQMLRAQRMECIGALASGIAHDLNNVLIPILLATELMERIETAPEDERLLEAVKSGAQRGLELVKQVLQFARGVKRKEGPIHFGELAADLAKLVRHAFPRSISFETNIADDLFPADGDSAQIHQVLLNLCINARDAIQHENGVVSLEVRNTVLRDHVFQMTPKLISGSFVELRVSDNGSGIPPQVLPRIFEPFFTTKEEGKGTGLGLSTVLTIVRNHSGFLEVSSAAGAGTVFSVFLPANSVQQDEHRWAAHEQTLIGKNEWVLMIDDEKAVLEMTKAFLEAYNYNVLTAYSLPEGLMMLETNTDKIKAVVVDLPMPGLDSAQFIATLEKQAPEAIVVFLGDETLFPESARPHAVLKKPCSMAKLLEELARLMEANH